MNHNYQKMILFFFSQGSVNPKVFIEFGFKNKSKKLGKIEFELFENIVPRTVENFMSLITHKHGFGYKKSKLHRIIPKFVIQGGDFDNRGGYSIYGKYFEDEGFSLKHDTAGLLSMANCGPNTNGSQFFITLDYTPWLDGKHVIFGRIINGMNIASQIEKYGTTSGEPKDKIYIINCGISSNY